MSILEKIRQAEREKIERAREYEERGKQSRLENEQYSNKKRLEKEAYEERIRREKEHDYTLAFPIARQLAQEVSHILNSPIVETDDNPSAIFAISTYSFWTKLLKKGHVEVKLVLWGRLLNVSSVNGLYDEPLDILNNYSRNRIEEYIAIATTERLGTRSAWSAYVESEPRGEYPDHGSAP